MVKIIKKHFRFLKCFFFALTLIYSSSANSAAHCLSKEQQLNSVKDWSEVSRIVDGDTIHLKNGRKIRFIGINTPEIGYKGKPSQPFSQQAKKSLQSLLQQNQKVGLYYDKERKDKYKRTLAYVILSDGQNVAEVLLKKGLAQSIVVPPNDQQINCFRQLEKQARQANSGIWQLAENQLISAAALPLKTKGYRLISGQISSYNESRKSIYLQLTNKLAIRIAKKDKRYFSNTNLKSIVGKKVLVRGWLNTYKGRQSIHLRSEHDLEITPEEIEFRVQSSEFRVQSSERAKARAKDINSR